MQHRCPICGKPVEASSREPPKQVEFFPFCSQRCKLLDLGVWLDGEYRISSDLQSGQSQESTPAPSDNPSDAQ